MKKNWSFLLLSVFLILTLAACTQTNGASAPPDQAPPTPEVEQEADADHDDAADDQEDADTDHSDSDMDQDEEDEADAEEEAVAIDAAALFAENCAKCHGQNREGGGGPPLLPARLTKDPSAYVKTITEGSGPMPTFGGRFSAEEIDALVEFILSDVE